MRSYEKLMGSDKVDLILPPWGSNANFAVAPLANRFGYPFIAPTALSKRLIEMKLPYFFLMLQQPQADDERAGRHAQGQRRQDRRGDLRRRPVRPGELRRAEGGGERQRHQPGRGEELPAAASRTCRPVLRGIKDKNPDAFVALSYPPDTILASRQSKEIGFNPKFFYASVGTAFQLYRNVMGAGAEGVLGMGSWNAKSSAGAKAYFDAHVKKFGTKEPDRWASGATWASLEILQSAVGQGGPGPQGDPRLRGRQRPTTPSSARSSSTAARTSARPAR